MVIEKLNSMSNEGNNPPRNPIYEIILSSSDLWNIHYRAIISTLVTALKREENVIISSPSNKISQKKVSEFVRYIVCKLIPATTSVISKSNFPQFYENQTDSDDNDVNNYNKKKKSKNSINSQSSPFFSNVCIVEDFDKIGDTSPIIRVMKELVITIDGEEQPKPLPVPFFLVALVNETSHLPRNTLGSFSFHINIQSLPSKIPTDFSPFYPTYDAFLQVLSIPVFAHRDITTYISQLVLNVDCKPLLTSFLEVKTKLLLVKAIDDCALLNDRNYIITDDVQMIFPMLVTHRFLLPGPTSFRNCLDFVYNLIDTLPVPI